MYKRLLQLRREQMVPRLKGIRSEGAQVVGPGAVVATWRFLDGACLVLAANLGETSVSAALPNTQPLWGHPARDNIPPATTLAWILEP